MSDGVISKIQLPNENTYDIIDNTSGYITGMTILSYGSSTWNDFIAAYNANKVVYCRASSNSNPASGSQTRLAFLAYVNNATTPTEVEFQYYRSVSSHSDSQQGDQVYVYKLKNTGVWSVTVRESYTKIDAGGDLSKSYSNGTLTISGTIPTVPSNVSAFTNDAGYLTSYTETDPVFNASAAAGITSTDISNWNSAEANVQSDWNQSDNTADDYIKNKPTVTLNGSAITSPSFYAPTTAGTSGQFLQSSGSGAPSWTNFPTIVNTRETPASGGTTLSLVNTGDMYTWNNKSNVQIVRWTSA